MEKIGWKSNVITLVKGESVKRFHLNVCIGFPQAIHDEIDSKVKVEIFEV